MNDRFASILLIFAFAALLAILSVHRQIAAAVVAPSGARGGPTNFGGMSGDAGYMNYNWGPPAAMAFMLPQTSQGGARSPLSNSPCEACS